MKIFDAFGKNLKLVSRNWSYFVVLFLCPLILISVASFVLSSGDVHNVAYAYETNISDHIELRNQESPMDIENDFSYSRPLRKGFSCSSYLTHYPDAGFCISKVSENEIEIYLDDTEKVASSYIKKTILEKIVQKQNYAMQETSEKINSKIQSYSVSLDKTSEELDNIYSELESQEEMLMNYSEKIEAINRDFDEFYYPMKNFTSQLKEMNDPGEESGEEFFSEINKTKENLNEINYDFQDLDSFLQDKLTDQEYTFASAYLSNIDENINEINSSLTFIENNYPSQAFSMTDQEITEFENNLDEIKSTLDQLEEDIDVSLERTRESKRKIKDFQEEIDSYKKDLSSFSGIASENMQKVSFVDAFGISDDPIYTKFPLLVALIIVFTSLVLSNMFIIKKVSQKSHIREIFSPISDTQVLISDYLINMFFVLIQGAVLCGFSYLFFGISESFLISFFLSIFVVSSILVFLGMSFGYLIKNNNLSILVTVFVLMFFLIVSSVMTPPLIASDAVKFLMSLNPLYILTEVLFGSFLLNQGLESFDPFIINLSFLFLAGIGLLIFSKKMNKKKISK